MEVIIKRLQVFAVVLALVATTMVVSMSPASAHGSSSNFCGGNHTYWAYSHHINRTTALGSGRYEIQWKAKPVVGGGWIIHSKSICG